MWSEARKLPKKGYFCNYGKKGGKSAISGYFRGKNAIFPN
jgi:hypothetical protein